MLRLTGPLPKAVTERSRIFERGREQAWKSEQALLYAQRLAVGVDPDSEEEAWRQEQQRVYSEWRADVERLELEDVDMGEDEDTFVEEDERRQTDPQQEAGGEAASESKPGNGVPPSPLQEEARKPPKTFVKALGLVMDRGPNAKLTVTKRMKFLDPKAQEMYVKTGKFLVQKYTHLPSDEFWEKLEADDFLEADIDRSLEDRYNRGPLGGDFGRDIWGKKNEAYLVVPEPPHKWGIYEEESGEERTVQKYPKKLCWEEDKHTISWNFRCWIVSRIWEQLEIRALRATAKNLRSEPVPLQQGELTILGEAGEPISQPSTLKESDESPFDVSMTIPSSIDVDNLKSMSDAPMHKDREHTVTPDPSGIPQVHRALTDDEDQYEKIRIILQDNLAQILDQNASYVYIKPCVYVPALNITLLHKCNCNSTSEHHRFDCLNSARDIVAWVTIIEKVEEFLDKTGYTSWTPGRNWHSWTDYVAQKCPSERVAAHDELSRLRAWGEGHDLQHSAAVEAQWAVGMATYFHALLGGEYRACEFRTLVCQLYDYNEHLLDWFRERNGGCELDIECDRACQELELFEETSEG